MRGSLFCVQVYEKITLLNLHDSKYHINGKKYNLNFTSLTLLLPILYPLVMLWKGSLGYSVHNRE